MRGISLSQGTLSVSNNLSLPSPARGEALIRVALAGVCSTDLELVGGYYPFEGILGHEFVGVVEACDGAAEWIGKRVVSTINLSPECNGKCGSRCPEHCPDRTVVGIVGRNGVFAEYVALPVANLLAVPDSVPDEQAVFTEPLAAALRISEQIDPRDSRVTIIGAGRLGLLCAQALRARGAQITVVGRSEKSRNLSQELGFPTYSTKKLPDSALPAAPLIVECTASPDGLRLAVELCPPEGTIVLKSTYADQPGDARFAGFASVLAAVVVNEIRIQGSRCGPFDQALAMLAAGEVNTDSMVEARYPLSDGLAAIAHAARPGARKILLHP